MTSSPAPLDKHGVAILEMALATLDAENLPLSYCRRALRLLIAERLVQHRSTPGPVLFDKTEEHDKAVERAAPAGGGGANATTMTDTVSGRRLAEEQARAAAAERRVELTEVCLKEAVGARDNLRKALVALTTSVALVDKAAEPVGRSAGVEGFVIIPAGAWKNLVVATGDIARDHGLKAGFR